ncbi:hypothetical protein ACJIZ3_025081 [Penstemon smallii]|uniref:CID domain-containing protein n=1 Tax=Penstemon smallii TaxID=265156 RepID=A0ABD3TW72_9LAMI
MPISNGSFTKPASFQNDAVGAKPLPPLILDRFRAMLKKREEELMVFGGEAGTDEIVRIYEIVLASLTLNSKPMITDLTIIAGEQRAHGEGIADAICSRIIEAPVDQKLPSLYLLDSIVKNIGKEYIRYFSTRLPEVFCEAYAQVHPNMHHAMQHLFGTWSAVFPLSVLRKIEAKLQFSTSVHGQPSGLGSLNASESPRTTHGIHVNPKYARHQFGHSTVDTVGAEVIKKPLPSAARIIKSASPYRIGNGGSLSPSLEEFSVDNSPNRLAVGASSSHAGIDFGFSRRMDREEETNERQTRNWQGNSNQHLKTSAVYNYTNNVDLRGPRALINAYGIDEREKKLKRKHETTEQLDANGVDPKVATRTWQNTEEEEFDWEDMTPGLSDRRQCNEIRSSIQPPSNSMASHRFTTNCSAPLVTDYRENWSKARFSSVPNSSFEDDINFVQGSINGIAGPSDSINHIPSSFGRESSILQPQQSQSHFNAKGGGPFPESKSFSSAGELNPPVIGNFPNAEGLFSGPGNAMSIFNSTYDSPAPDTQSASAAALSKAWYPSKLLSTHNFPSVSAPPMQTQIRGQFGTENAGNVGSIRSMSQMNFPQVPNHRPGPVLNLQSPAQASLVQPNMSMPREVRQNFALPSGASLNSHAMVPPPTYGYLAQGHVPRMNTTSSNLVPSLHPHLANNNTTNMPFHPPGPALPSLFNGPLPGSNRPLPVGQNIGQVASNPQAGGALSGLISSLVAQGLISLAKQDSVGVEFDQENLKVRHESAISALYADLPRQCTSCGLRFKSQEEHSKHMDWHVNKNRTLRNRKTKPSSKWFVSGNMWLHGAEALGTEAVPGFFPTENIVEKQEDEEMAVPADEDQNACALCGEPFDDFYSDETEEWMYKGAVYMYAPAGSTLGMDRSQLGPIVHAKCRSDSNASPSEDITKDEEGSTEEDKQRKRLRS